MFQVPLPSEYTGLSDEETASRIRAAKAALGSRLVILGHHYQRDAIIEHADFRGDSYKLAKDAAKHPEAEFIVFCGVHFMAESADILTPETQTVILPNMAAGCSMADMANLFQVKSAWKQLQDALRVPAPEESDIGKILVQLGMVGEREVLQARAQERGMGFVDVDRITIDPYAIDAVPEQIARAHDVIPVRRETDVLYLAMNDPDNLQGICEVGESCGLRVVPVLATPDAISNALEKYYPGDPVVVFLRQPEKKRRTYGAKVIPVTYINSAANLKGFVGEHDGTVCTSTNAPQAVRWALEHGDKVLFFPDQHLGRNTGVKLGYDPEKDMCVWDPFKPLGGNTPEKLRQSTFILWKGHCSVHARFTVEQIEKARNDFPGVKVLVHPECSLEVVNASDLNGSTEFILKTITESPAGSIWAVGTEINLVSRLASEQPDKTIFCLDPQVCPCSTMYRIHPSFLLWTLENLVKGEVLNRVEVPDPTKTNARKALEQMLRVGG